MTASVQQVPDTDKYYTIKEAFPTQATITITKHGCRCFGRGVELLVELIRGHRSVVGVDLYNGGGRAVITVVHDGSRIERDGGMAESRAANVARLALVMALCSRKIVLGEVESALVALEDPTDDDASFLYRMP